MHHLNKSPFYRYIDLDFNPEKDKDSWYIDWEDFYHLRDMISYIEENNIKKEKIYINSIKHYNRRNLNAITMAESFNRIKNADVECPIIINWDWSVLDWFHRITKCILEHKKRIRAYRISLSKIRKTKTTQQE